MPPRTSTAVVRTVTGNGPLLPFLYPAASRRFLSTTSPKNQNESSGNEKFIGMLDSLRTSASTDLPSLPDENPTSHSQRPAQSTDFVSMQQRQLAFKDMHHLNLGASAVVRKLEDMVKTRKGLEESMERVDPEIFRHTAPILDRSFISPKDLSYEEYQKFGYQRRNHTRADVFEILKEDPLSYYKNFNLLKDFMTTAGRIKHRSITGLSNVHQRKVSKAIRRAIGIVVICPGENHLIRGWASN